MFKSSITIGKIFDIPIRIHVSFLIILPFLAWAFGNNIKYITENSDINYSELVLNPHFLGLLLAIGLFTSVLLHELSHSLVAKSKGIPINSITLMLFGGVSSMEELTENPDDEARMAMAGPLLSIVLGIILILIYNYLSAAFIEDVKLLVLYLGQLNIFLAIFNLLPAFPSDGGRILRALLASRTSFLQATKIAVSVGKVFAFGFGLLGLISGNFMLIFIGFFLYIGASQEYQYNHIKSALAEMKVTDLMSRDVDTITEDMSVEKLIDKMYDKKHSGYPVVREERVVGMVTMTDIQKVDPARYSSTPVKQIMSREIKEVRPRDDVYRAFKLLFQQDIGRLVVQEDGRLKGIITRSDILKAFRIKQLEERGIRMQ